MKVSGPGEWTESCGATVPPCTELRVPSYLPVSSCWLQLPASRRQINQRCQITLQIIWSHAGRHKLTQFMQKVCSQSIFWIKAFLWESCFNLQKVAFCRQMVCWMKFRLRPNFVQGCPFFVFLFFKKTEHLLLHVVLGRCLLSHFNSNIWPSMVQFRICPLWRTSVKKTPSLWPEVPQNKKKCIFLPNFSASSRIAKTYSIIPELHYSEYKVEASMISIFNRFQLLSLAQTFF